MLGGLGTLTPGSATLIPVLKKGNPEASAKVFVLFFKVSCLSQGSGENDILALLLALMLLPTFIPGVLHPLQEGWPYSSLPFLTSNPNFFPFLWALL